MNQHGHHNHDHPSPAHPGPQAGAQLIVGTGPSRPAAGRPTDLRLMIHAADGTMVRSFDTVHQQKVHLVLVREGLDHFAHIHPAVDAQGGLSITHTFPAGGAYRLYADFTPSGGSHAVATGSLVVEGTSPPAPSLAPDAPGEVAADGVRATIGAAPLRAAVPARVTFALRDDAGMPAGLEPYMGELGHLMFVGIGSWQYVHVHPAGGDAARGTIEFEAHFPEPGLYKGWGQFRSRDRVRIVPFVVKVE